MRKKQPLTARLAAPARYAILRRMMTRKLFPFWRRPALGILLGGALIALSACGAAGGVIGRRSTPTPEGIEQPPRVARTATPGGVLSVWVVTPPDGSAPQSENATPNATVPGSRPVGPAATATAAFATIEAATAVAAAPRAAPYY